MISHDGVLLNRYDLETWESTVVGYMWEQWQPQLRPFGPRLTLTFV